MSNIKCQESNQNNNKRNQKAMLSIESIDPQEDRQEGGIRRQAVIGL